MPLKDIPEYNIWKAMRQRCNNPSNKRYHRYGGRGIKVCYSWGDFKNFISDMGFRPSPKHSIDRVDNDGDYEKDNCRWATNKEQCANRSSTVMNTHYGESMSKASFLLGGTKNLVRERIHRYGWDKNKAFTTPAPKKITLCGKSVPA